MRNQIFIFLILALSSFFSSQTEAVDRSNISELLTTNGSSVTIPCDVDGGTHWEYTPMSWTRVTPDGYTEMMILYPDEPDFVPRRNVELLEITNNPPSLVVSNMEPSFGGVYTCHTDKGNASTLVRVENELPAVASSIESQKQKQSCSKYFELVHGRCLYYSYEKKNWPEAHEACSNRTSSLITFKDVKDLMSFLLNLQNSGPTYYNFPLWAGHASFEVELSSFGPLQNDAQVSPMLSKRNAITSYCGYLPSLEISAIHGQDGSGWPPLDNFNFLCEQPTFTKV